MNVYQIEVEELRTYRVIYTIEANSLDKAWELASIGESEHDWLEELDQVDSRRVLRVIGNAFTLNKGENHE